MHKAWFDGKFRFYPPVLLYHPRFMIGHIVYLYGWFCRYGWMDGWMDKKRSPGGSDGKYPVDRKMYHLLSTYMSSCMCKAIRRGGSTWMMNLG